VQESGIDVALSIVDVLATGSTAAGLRLPSGRSSGTFTPPFLDGTRVERGIGQFIQKKYKPGLGSGHPTWAAKYNSSSATAAGRNSSIEGDAHT